jgi:hypothetical protein
MGANISEAKQHAHHLLDQLGPRQLAAVVHLLETLVPPEEDRDTLSDAEQNAIAEANEWLKHNPPITHEEVLAEFGLTMADWEKMGQESPWRSSRRWPATPIRARGTQSSFGITNADHKRLGMGDDAGSKGGLPLKATC